MLAVHVIPVGGAEPIHEARPRCWCYPCDFDRDGKLMVHNAADLREVRERRGLPARPREFWVHVLGPGPGPGG